MSIESVVGYIGICDSCQFKSDICKIWSDLSARLKKEGWEQKVFFENKLAKETWDCPTCIQNKKSEPLAIDKMIDEGGKTV